MVQILPTGWRLFTAHIARCNMGASAFDGIRDLTTTAMLEEGDWR